MSNLREHVDEILLLDVLGQSSVSDTLLLGLKVLHGHWRPKFNPLSAHFR